MNKAYDSSKADPKQFEYDAEILRLRFALVVTDREVIVEKVVLETHPSKKKELFFFQFSYFANAFALTPSSFAIARLFFIFYKVCENSSERTQPTGCEATQSVE